MAQNIHLTTEEILSFLMELENKLPRKYYSEFDSSRMVVIRSEEDLNAAARMMMDFVGLTAIVPQCMFTRLDETHAGKTYCSPNNNVLPIWVSNRYMGNRDAILAVLAHEICHKVCQANGIWYPLPEAIKNEIITDLCTIYVGFGRLVLTGYTTQRARSSNYNGVTMETSLLGYLKFDVYQMAYDIVTRIVKNDSLMARESHDYRLTDAFNLWNGTTTKRELFLKSFSETQDVYAKLTRDINLLEQLLAEMKECYHKTLVHADKCYFGRGEFFDRDRQGVIKPIALFAAIYDTMMSEGNQAKLKHYDQFIKDTLAKLVELDEDFQIEELKYHAFECPICHKKSTKLDFDNRKLVTACPSCHTHFYLNCEHLHRTVDHGKLRLTEKKEGKGRAFGWKWWRKG